MNIEMKQTSYITSSQETYRAPRVKTIDIMVGQVLCSSLDGFLRYDDSEEWFNE